MLELHLAGNRTTPGKRSNLEFSFPGHRALTPLQLPSVCDSFGRVTGAQNSMITKRITARVKGGGGWGGRRHLASDPANTCTHAESRRETRASKNDLRRRRETTTPLQRCSEDSKDFVQLLPYLLYRGEGNTVTAVHDRPAGERTALCQHSCAKENKEVTSSLIRETSSTIIPNKLLID